jgi:hypothetical protein
VPFNLKVVGSIADAEAQDLTVSGVAYTPYRPVNFCANAESLVSRYDNDIILTWSARMRSEGAGLGIPGVALSTTTREGFFEVEVYVNSILVRTTTAIDAITWTYTSAMNITDNGALVDEITFKLSNYLFNIATNLTYRSIQTIVVCRKN